MHQFRTAYLFRDDTSILIRALSEAIRPTRVNNGSRGRVPRYLYDILRKFPNRLLLAAGVAQRWLILYRDIIAHTQPEQQGGVWTCAGWLHVRSSDLISRFHPGQKYIRIRGHSACVRRRETRRRRAVCVRVYVQRIAPESERPVGQPASAIGIISGRCFFVLTAEYNRQEKRGIPLCTIDYNPRIARRDVTYCDQRNKSFGYQSRRKLNLA